MSYIFKKGATSQSIELYIVDSTDGTPETGVVFNTAGIDLKYRRKDAAVVSITEAALTTPALTDTWETGGFLEIGNGVYRLDLPDAALASAAGIDRVVVFGTVTGMVVLPVTIHLTDIDFSDAVRGGMTALPNANADGVGGLPISDAGGLDLDAIATNAARLTAVRAAVLTDWIDGGRLDLLLDAVNTVTPDAAGVAPTAVEIQAEMEADGASILDTLRDDLADGGRLDLLIDAIKAVTDNMSAAAGTMVTGTVSHDNTIATTTVIYSDDITEATADHYNGRLFVPTSGALVGQYTDITDYALDTGEGKFTVTALTEAPADNTTFVII